MDKFGLGQLDLPPASTPQGVERDEIEAMVLRLKQADTQRAKATPPAAAKVAPADLQWAQEWELPSDVFDYFTIERMA